MFPMTTVQLLTCSHPQLLVLTVSEYVGLKQTNTLLENASVYSTLTHACPYWDTMKWSIVFSCR